MSEDTSPSAEELAFADDRSLGWLYKVVDRQWQFVGAAQGVVCLGRDDQHAFIKASTAFGDADVEELIGIPHLIHMEIAWSNLTDAGLTRIGELFPELRVLDFHATAISDEGLRALAPLQQLRYLPLGEMGISDEGFKHLAVLSSLEHISMFENGITYMGLSYLREMITLNSVVLGKEYGVTSAGMEYLARSGGMTQLRVSHTSAASAGVNWLRHFPLLEILDVILPDEESFIHIAPLVHLRELFATGSELNGERLRLLERVW